MTNRIHTTGTDYFTLRMVRQKKKIANIVVKILNKKGNLRFLLVIFFKDKNIFFKDKKIKIFLWIIYIAFLKSNVYFFAGVLSTSKIDRISSWLNSLGSSNTSRLDPQVENIISLITFETPCR